MRSSQVMGKFMGHCCPRPGAMKRNTCAGLHGGMLADASNVCHAKCFRGSKFSHNLGSYSLAECKCHTPSPSTLFLSAQLEKAWRRSWILKSALSCEFQSLSQLSLANTTRATLMEIFVGLNASETIAQSFNISCSACLGVLNFRM